MGNQKSLRVGELAPDFELELLTDTQPDTAKAAVQRKGSTEPSAKPKTVKLSSFRGKKPVVLIFGSYT